MEDKLPNKLSELLTVAVNDFRKVLKRKIKGVTPNMSVWAEKASKNEPCQVCLAGAALVGTCKIKPVAGSDIINSVPLAVKKKAHAINRLRGGEVMSAFCDMREALGHDRYQQDVSPEQDLAINRARDLISKNYRYSGRYGKKDARHDDRAPLKIYDKAAQILAAAGL